MKDPDSGVAYCVQIKIERRPKGKLPKSQNPDGDRYFAARSLFNEVDNGNDVSDEEWQKGIGPEYKLDKKTGEKKPIPFSPEYSKAKDKLIDIRAKKVKDLKAPPPADKK